MLWKRVVFTALFYYNYFKHYTEVLILKENDTKNKPKQRKHKQSLNNKKHQNNKILKAKEIIARNKAALEKESEKKADLAKRSLPARILRILKRTLLGVVIVVFAAVIISFIVVRINGGTPELFGYSVQRISSGSMEPTLMVGDIILSKHVDDPSEIVIDDIITFKGGSDFEYNNVTHRVVVPPMEDINGNCVLTTKGDANISVDKEINFEDVNSKMISKIDFLNKFYDFFMSPWGLIIFIAALLIIFFDELLTVVKVITGNYEEDEEDDESVSEIMDRLKAEEIEREKAEAERKERARKRNNTSKKKQKRRSEKNNKPSEQIISSDKNHGDKTNSKKSKKKKK